MLYEVITSSCVSRVPWSWPSSGVFPAGWTWIVITSYSIHYTKLYDARCLQLPVQKLRSVGGMAKTSMINRERKRERAVQNRITSYNVCYTKLLRTTPVVTYLESANIYSTEFRHSSENKKRSLEIRRRVVLDCDTDCDT